MGQVVDEEDLIRFHFHLPGRLPEYSLVGFVYLEPPRKDHSFKVFQQGAVFQDYIEGFRRHVGQKKTPVAFLPQGRYPPDHGGIDDGPSEGIQIHQGVRQVRRCVIVEGLTGGVFHNHLPVVGGIPFSGIKTAAVLPEGGGKLFGIRSRRPGHVGQVGIVDFAGHDTAVVKGNGGNTILQGHTIFRLLSPKRFKTSRAIPVAARRMEAMAEPGPKYPSMTER